MSELKRLRSSLQSSAEDLLSAAVKLSLKSSKSTLKALIHSIPRSSPLATSLPLALNQSISESIASFQNFPENPGSSSPTAAKSPPTKRPRRSARKSKSASEECSEDGQSNDESRKQKIVENLQVLACVAELCVSSPKKAFEMENLLPAVRALHDNLILFESDSILSGEISSLCEEWWKEGLPEREALISQFLPFLMSRSLTRKKKVDVHRVYSIREAFSLFDFEDDSIEDLKLLLIRCVIAPLYLKTEEGRKFVAFMFGLSRQLMKEALAMIKAQIPFGRKSMLESFGDILFRAWKIVEGDMKEELENGFLLSLVEGAIHASSGVMAASIRRVLGGFINQRTFEGVEKVLFRLAEPVIFRSLQAANSNVRQNALHVLLDMFPLEDPDSTKEAKDSLLDKQFYLLERLLFDDCPDIRAVAVEGCCRILHLFWEIIPSSTITSILTKIFDDMSYDTCIAVRLSTLNAIMYLLGNPQSHEILKVLLHRIGHLIMDNVLFVRVALADLLLLIRDIQAFQFNKVVALEELLSALSDDQPQVAQKITRLLIPSYFPSKVSSQEACSRFITLLKRSPKAGAKFCEYAFMEGASIKSLMELFKVIIHLVVSPDQLREDQIEGFLGTGANLCKNLANEPSYGSALKEMLPSDRLMSLFAVAPTALAQSSLFSIVSAISPDDASGIIEECMGIAMNCNGVSGSAEKQAEARSAHKLLLSCGRIDNILESFTKILQKTAFRCHKNFGVDVPKRFFSSVKRKKSQSSVKLSSKWKYAGQKKSSSFEEDYLISAGISWQIKDLLSSENSRTAILESKYLEPLLVSLKVISEVSIVECLCSEYMDAYPLLSYTALAIHMASGDFGSTGKDHSTARKNGSTGSSECNMEALLVETMDNLLNCGQKLFAASCAGPVPFNPNPDQDSNVKLRSQGQKSRKSVADASSQKNFGTGTSNATRRSLCCISTMVKLLTAILKFLTDTVSLGFDFPDPERCLKFTSTFFQHIVSSIRQQLFDPSYSKETADLKETILCLNSSFSYALKLLSLVLPENTEDPSPLLERFNLANHLVNLIASIELDLGSNYAACFVTSLKPWLPDLVVALGSGFVLHKTRGDTGIALFEFIKLNLPPWFSVLAKIEIAELNETEEENGGVEQQKSHLVLQKVVAMVVSLVGTNKNLLDAIGVVFLAGSARGLEVDDFGLVLGLVRFVCVKLVRPEDRDKQWSELDMMLGSLCSIYPQIEKRIEEEEGEETLASALALLEPIWTYHLYETERFTEMEE